MKRLRVLTRANFTKWVARQKPGASVGKSCLMDDCPIVRFIESTVGKEDVVTVLNSISILKWNVEATARSHREDYAIPKWANAFITEIDRRDGEHVTREHALKVLS